MVEYVGVQKKVRPKDSGPKDSYVELEGLGLGVGASCLVLEPNAREGGCSLGAHRNVSGYK
jgi:hypothetical protein